MKTLLIILALFLAGNAIGQDYETIQDLSKEYSIWMFIEPQNGGISYGDLLREYEQNGWQDEFQYGLKESDDRYARTRGIFGLLPPSMDKDSSIVFVEHEAGIELLGFKNTGYVNTEKIHQFFKSVFSKISGRLSGRIDPATGDHDLEIILKGANWEFRTKGMPLDKLAEIQEFMVKFR